jgi:hypothetical protein
VLVHLFAVKLLLRPTRLLVTHGRMPNSLVRGMLYERTAF